jgi:hypothetical protein
MDCIDCHNRPTHAFDLPGRALDKAITEGRVSREIPYIKKMGLELLKAEYPDRRTADTRIPQALAEYYKASHPDAYKEHRAQIEAAGAALSAIHRRNVFPDMRLTWGTHPNHIGHEDFPGCFRCHDESHKSKDGKTISQDCEACHTVLAQDEENPEILKQLGVQ